MSNESKIKKIRTQLKFGRVVEAETALLTLLPEVRDTSDEIDVLALFCFDLEMATGSYASAQQGLQRLRTLPISDDMRQRVDSALAICQAENNKVESEPNYDGEEFINFIKSIPAFLERLTSGVIVPNPDWILLQDFEKAVPFAHHQDINPPYISWNGVRTLAAKEVHSFCFASKIRLQRYDKGYAPKISEMTMAKLTGRVRYFTDDVFGDLIEIGRGILVGKKVKLHEMMLDAYKAGFFPCGWRGIYPEGSLMVCSDRATSSGA